MVDFEGQGEWAMGGPQETQGEPLSTSLDVAVFE